MSPAAESLAAGSLGALGPKLGEGGQAVVYTAPAHSLPDAPGPLVYKQYKDQHHPPQGLHRLVKVRNKLDPAVRARLDQRAAWPLRVVEEGGQVRGVVMPLIPDAFMQTRVLPGTGATTTGPREVQNLLIPPDRARVIGMPWPTTEQRLRVCRDLAAALHLLHRNNLVFGDFNAKNELYRLGGVPTAMLVDCDAVRISGNAAVVAQLNAPDWEAPERWLTKYTDCYKYGLFVLRCLSTGEQASTTYDPARADAALDDEGRTLLRSALSADPGARPTMQDWGRYLDYLLTGRRSAPVSKPAAASPLPVQHRGWQRDKVTGKWTRQ